MECMQSNHGPGPKPYANAPSQIHARLGELQYMAATASGAGSGSYQKYMAEAIKRFSRSIELCDDYLRGYYGLKLVRPPFERGETPWQLTLSRSPRSCSSMVPR